MSLSNRIVASLVLLVGAVLFLSTPSARAAGGDLSDPKSAAKTFFNALLNNDMETVRSCAVGTGPEMHFVESMAALVAGQKKLATAAEQKYGEDGKKLAPMRLTEFQQQLEAAEVKIEGDEATIVTKASADHPLKLMKADGQWKVELSTIQPARAGNTPEVMNTFAKVFSETADEISAGKYPTMQDAGMALQQKMMAAQRNLGGAGGGGAGGASGGGSSSSQPSSK